VAQQSLEISRTRPDNAVLDNPIDITNRELLRQKYRYRLIKIAGEENKEDIAVGVSDMCEDLHVSAELLQVYATMSVSSLNHPFAVDRLLKSILERGQSIPTEVENRRSNIRV
jgi:hypothetical protein